MVNKKLSEKEEDDIYLQWLIGRSLVSISKDYPVVISTIQRVINKKRSVDGTKRNCILSGIFKHLKNANGPLLLSLKMLDGTGEESLHCKQKESLLSNLKELSDNLDVLVKKVQTLNIQSVINLEN